MDGIYLTWMISALALGVILLPVFKPPWMELKLTTFVDFFRRYWLHILMLFMIYNAKVGLEIKESIINSDSDESLNDNAAGYSNYTAPGADRLSIQVRLKAIKANDRKPSNFIDLMEVRNGNLVYVRTENDYNELGNELAKRTFDESGNYYVRPFTLTARETLNNYQGNNGIFNSSQVTYNNNVPSDDLATYKISPGKAFIKGVEVPGRNVVYLDFEKTRVKKTLKNQAVNYYTGPTLTVNRAYGCPRIGFTTTSSISLRDSRIGANAHVASGKEIGVARVYDYALESGSYSSALPATNEFDVTLYDIQPYTEITVNQAVTLTVPTFIKGKSSGSTAHLRFGTTTGIITAYNSSGSFSPGEKLIFNGVDDNRIATAITAHSIGAVESIHSAVGVGTFNADVKQFTKIAFGNVNITPKSGTAPGISTVTITGGGFSDHLINPESIKVGTYMHEAMGATLISLGFIALLNRDMDNIVTKKLLFAYGVSYIISLSGSILHVLNPEVHPPIPALFIMAALAGLAFYTSKFSD